MIHNEDSRVKIPALLHLMKLGYQYIPMREQVRREDTNIFTELFIQAVERINNGNYTSQEVKKELEEVSLLLDYEDLGEAFYKRILDNSNMKLIDFQNFENNSFHVTTELTYKKDDEEFRPDITVLINGMTLAFVEVKKPHNKDGVLAERKRINDRFKNKHFRKFVNITQLMVFSNNMEYEDGVIEPIFGAYYATAAYSDINFNYFREDPDYPVQQRMLSIDDATENAVLKDTNLLVIKNSPEFITNKQENTPTNRILTSLFCKERLAFLLKYAIAYVQDEVEGIKVFQKHIMRYPQVFATMAIAKKLDEGQKKGIIWHTQGSGKTALTYYNVKHLTDYFQKKNVIPKFYFIVDRIDLATQATTEFSNRGLRVKAVNSKADFISDLKTVSAVHNHAGQAEISVINIQKFSDDARAAEDLNYDVNVQRVYIIDEAHRSYNPKGNYLANLINSDKDAIIIALTGTPLLKEVAKEYDSKALFGSYFHKYYYNMSIADGYTLRLIREEIEGGFKMQMQDVLDAIEIQQGDIKKSQIYAHPTFVEPLLEYITNDLIQFRKREGDASLGGMVVCDSSDQAKELFRLFEEKYGTQETDASVLMAAESKERYGIKEENPKLTASLILHDENDKQIRKDLISAYKKGKIDLLFVYNMLLTGFDAKRLKKLYLTRIIKDHNLLQTLTRVNRPYKNYRYGYVVDFADISPAFDRTNRLYFDELQNELGDDFAQYNALFKSEKEIKEELEGIRETLFRFDTSNKEEFSRQIEQIIDKNELMDVVKALRSAKELKNLISLNGFEDLNEFLDFKTLNRLLIDAQNRLDNLNLLESIGSSENSQNILNEALEDIVFQFIKISEEELVLADEFKDILRKTREVLQRNIDPRDPKYVSLREELERIFKRNNLNEMSQLELKENSKLLRDIYEKARSLNDKNEQLSKKYNNDAKFTRVHKRLLENGELNAKETQIHAALSQVKEAVDEKLEMQDDIIENESYFNRLLLQLVIQEFKNKQQMPLDFETTNHINRLIVREYIQQYQNR